MKRMDKNNPPTKKKTKQKKKTVEQFISVDIHTLQLKKTNKQTKNTPPKKPKK